MNIHDDSVMSITNLSKKSEPFTSYIKRFLDELDSTRDQNWAPDDAASTCFRCHTGFTFSLRRHHCRICGNIFCTKCCTTKSITDDTIVRVCDKCLNLLHGFVKDLKSFENKRKYSVQFETWE